MSNVLDINYLRICWKLEKCEMQSERRGARCTPRNAIHKSHCCKRTTTTTSTIFHICIFIDLNGTWAGRKLGQGGNPAKNVFNDRALALYSTHSLSLFNSLYLSHSFSYTHDLLLCFFISCHCIIIIFCVFFLGQGWARN